MKSAIFIILFIIYSQLLWAQDGGDLAVGGYLENKTSLLFSDPVAISDLANFRLEGNWDFAKRGGIETHLLVTATYQTPNLSDYYKKGSLVEGILSDTSNKILQSIFNSPLFNYNMFILDRALLKLYFSWCDLFIGRQMVAWGTGYAFNPTDIWNSKDPSDPEAPKTGINSLRMEIPFGAVSGLSLVLVPGKNIDLSSAGFRLKGNISRFDFSISGMSVMNAEREALGLPRKIILGTDLVGQIGNVAVWFEGAVINPIYHSGTYNDFDSLYPQIDIGLDYTFANGLYIMGEYFYNGLGHSNYKNYEAPDFIKLFGGDMAGLAQNYLVLALRKDVFDHFTLMGLMLGNVNDYSIMMIPSIEYSFSDNLAVKIGGQFSYGEEKKSEYGSMQSNSSLTVTGFF